MKPAPLPPSRPLTDDEKLFLRLDRTTPHGASGHAMARRLAKMGLGEFDGRVFVTNERGLAAVEGNAK